MEITLTKGKVTLIDDEDYEKIKDIKFHAQKCGKVWYAYHSGSEQVYLHRLLLDLNPSIMCDHINGNGLDNRKVNLRIANRSQNNMNVKKYSNKSSPFKGVSWNKEKKKWVSRICGFGKRYHLGYYQDEKEAALEYDKAAINLFGDYAYLNFKGSVSS